MSVELKTDFVCSSGRDLVDMKVVDGLLHDSRPISLQEIALRWILLAASHS
jgi:hypothetical protein